MGTCHRTRRIPAPWMIAAGGASPTPFLQQASHSDQLTQSLRSGSAPESKSCRATSKWPRTVALCRAVHPYCNHARADGFSKRSPHCHPRLSRRCIAKHRAPGEKPLGFQHIWGGLEPTANSHSAADSHCTGRSDRHLGPAAAEQRLRAHVQRPGARQSSHAAGAKPQHCAQAYQAPNRFPCLHYRHAELRRTTQHA